MRIPDRRKRIPGFEYGADSLGEDQGQVAGVDANGDSVVDEALAEEDWP